jgi:hypothetical protein
MNSVSLFVNSTKVSSSSNVHVICRN